MNGLARLTLRGRWGQVTALAATMLFSATLIGAFGLIMDTGLRGQVRTGEYADAPVLVGAPQALAVAGDPDVPVPGRAVMPADVAAELRAALPSSRVEADAIVPAILAADGHEPVSVDVHPWAAIALGDRDLATGQPPSGPHHVAVPGHLADSLGLDVGDPLHLGFGDEAVPFTITGLTTNDDAGIDVPDVYLTAGAARERGRADQHLTAVGVWPSPDDDVSTITRIAEGAGARTWEPDERGRLEVVAQGPATAMLVEAAGAFGGLALIVAVFTVTTLIGLQVRERSRELAMLRIVGATPKQVDRLLRTESRWVALSAATVGGAAGPLLGALLIAVIGSNGALPRGLHPVFGPWPFIVPVLVGLATAEIATTSALRRHARRTPLAHLDASEGRAVGLPRRALRAGGGWTFLVVGLAMAAAPRYASGEAASALPALSGLVIALSFGQLSPVVILGATRLARRPARRSATALLALQGMRHRAARTGGVLAPIALGVTLASVQLVSATTVGAIARDQVAAGRRADVLVEATATGVGRDTATTLAELPGVTAAEPVVAAAVLARGKHSDAAWQTVHALAMEGSVTEGYADLRFVHGDHAPPRSGEVALGVQGAALLEVRLRDSVTVVLPDGRAVHRRVTAIYERGIGFGEALLPIDDLQPATASGRPSALAVRVEQDDLAAVEERIRRTLESRPGLSVSVAPLAGTSDGSGDEAAFQILLLVVLFGYIAIACANSLVTAIAGRRAEFTLLRAVGATPAQLRAIPRWEAVHLATTACIVGTLAAGPGLAGMTYSLSNEERLLPAVPLVVLVAIVTVTFGLVLAVSALTTRSVTRVASTRNDA